MKCLTLYIPLFSLSLSRGWGLYRDRHYRWAYISMCSLVIIYLLNMPTLLFVSSFILSSFWELSKCLLKISEFFECLKSRPLRMRNHNPLSQFLWDNIIDNSPKLNLTSILIFQEFKRLKVVFNYYYNIIFLWMKENETLGES